MAKMTAVVSERGQFAAIAVLRWRLFVNSLRSKGGQLELGSRVVAAAIYAIGGLGAAIGLAFSAYNFIAHDKPELLAILLWPVFLGWQTLPIMISALSDNIELSGLLRFPITYRAYVLIRLLDGLMDIGTIFGTFCLLGILAGIAAARPSLLLPSVPILLTFALLNVLLSRMVFAWIERWLAQRRTRELMGGLFVVLLLGIQLINPILQHYAGTDHPQTIYAMHNLNALIARQWFLPPGTAAAAIADASVNEYARAIESALCLWIYVVGIGALFNIRLRAQYSGENLTEAGAQTVGKVKRPALKSTRLAARAGVDGTGSQPATAPVLAIMEKELLYIFRSGPLLISLLTPVVMLMVLGSQWHGENTYRFPSGMAYATLVLANLIYNCFGTDGSGAQIYFTAPVRMRTVVLAKNLTSVCILMVQMVIIFAAVSLIYGVPSLQIVMATVTWIFFSMPLNLALGSRLSMQSPKKMNYERFGRQQSSTLNALSSLGVQIVTIGSGALVLFFMRHHASLWPAMAIFAVLAATTTTIFLMMLKGVDQAALSNRETLVAELCKP